MSPMASSVAGIHTSGVIPGYSAAYSGFSRASRTLIVSSYSYQLGWSLSPYNHSISARALHVLSRNSPM